MSTEIERKETMRKPPPNPVEVLNSVAVMQAATLGFLIATQIVFAHRLSKLSNVKEVVIVYREVKEGQVVG